MAKIKDFEIRHIVKFRGHEEEPLQQGDIYYAGKKIGFYSDSAFGGDSIINIYQREEEIILNKVASEFVEENKKHPSISDFIDFIDKKAVFLEEILQLQDYEQLYKKGLKKGYKCLLVSYPTKEYNALYPQIYHCCTNFNFDKWFSEEKPAYAKYYTNINDFIIN